MATAYASVASAVEAVRRGACDYLDKPVDLEELRVVVDKALAHLRLTRELANLMERAVLLNSGPVVRAEDLGLTIQEVAAPSDRRRLPLPAAAPAPEPRFDPLRTIWHDGAIAPDIVERRGRAAGDCNPTVLVEEETCPVRR